VLARYVCQERFDVFIRLRDWHLFSFSQLAQWLWIKQQSNWIVLSDDRVCDSWKSLVVKIEDLGIGQLMHLKEIRLSSRLALMSK
jgi:hypothetical protein